MSDLTRGELAKQSGVNRETNRYYERNGLLPTPDRTEANYCLFAPKTVQRVRFIKRSQALGFTLNEVALLMELEEARACGKTRALARDKINAIDQKLTGLTNMRKALAALVRQCDAGESTKGCPIIHALAQGGFLH